jgi:predicted Fe-Mo cluster-binding NifX family protein
MRIAIPTMTADGLDAPVSPHFGHAPYLTMVDRETGRATAMPSPGHEGNRTPAQAIAESGVQAVLCGGIGGRAVQILNAAGIQVYVGAAGTVAEALAAHGRGEIQPATEESSCHAHGAEVH